MGKVREPKVLVVDTCFREGTAHDLLVGLMEQGHTIIWFDDPDVRQFLIIAHLIISPRAQMTPGSRLEYVVKKLKEIVKEVANGTSK